MAKKVQPRRARRRARRHAPLNGPPILTVEDILRFPAPTPERIERQRELSRLMVEYGRNKHRRFLEDLERAELAAELRKEALKEQMRAAAADNDRSVSQRLNDGVLRDVIGPPPYDVSDGQIVKRLESHEPPIKVNRSTVNRHRRNLGLQRPK